MVTAFITKNIPNNINSGTPILATFSTPPLNPLLRTHVFKTIQNKVYFSFLQMNSDDIKNQFRTVKYRRMKTIKPVMLTTN